MEKINVAELLKDCPSGMELDCVMYDNVQFVTVQVGDAYPIKINTPDGRISLTKYGCYSVNLDSKCVIFPKGKTTWEGFQRPFKDGDVVFYDDNIAIFKEWGDETLFRTYVTKYLRCDSLIDKNVPLFGKYIRKHTRLATEEEKQALFKAIKDNGYKWNPETKTLKKLEVNKFDISTLKPFERVLVRQNDYGKWGIDFFGFYAEGFYYTTGSAIYVQCVPYKDNEHLTGKTNNCDEYYKTWE